MRITALRRKPWGGPPAAAAEQQPSSGAGLSGQTASEGMQVDADQPEGQGMEEDGQQQGAQQAAQRAAAQQAAAQQGQQQPESQQGQLSAPQDVQQPAVRLHQAHDPELDAAAEAALADKGCWPADCARLAGEADIIAREWGGEVVTPWARGV